MGRMRGGLAAVAGGLIALTVIGACTSGGSGGGEASVAGAPAERAAPSPAAWRSAGPVLSLSRRAPPGYGSRGRRSVPPN